MKKRLFIIPVFFYCLVLSCSQLVELEEKNQTTTDTIQSKNDTIPHIIVSDTGINVINLDTVK